MRIDLLFISTFISLECVDKLLNSLYHNKYIQLKLVLVAQKKQLVNCSSYESRFVSIDVIPVEGILPSSVARNIGIKYVINEKIESDYVMFPDDDSSFDSSFFKMFKKYVKDDCGIVINVYDENSCRKYINHAMKDGASVDISLYKVVGSTNIVLPYSVFRKVGLFDENMGVGAKYGAGEDGDYFIRAVKLSSPFIYISALHCFHPSAKDKYSKMTLKQITHRFRSYGEGVVYLFFKHRMYKSIFVTCLKALCASMLFLFKFNVRFAYVYLCAFYYRVSCAFRLMREDRHTAD